MLIEVVLAMAILVLVTIGLYQVMRASITAAEEIRRSKQRSEQLAGFVELVRRSLDSLPNEASVTSSMREGSGGLTQALTVADASTAFAFGPGSAHYGPKSLILIPQTGGLSSLAIEYEPDPESRTPQTGEPPVLILLNDVRSIEWLFYDQRSASWAEKWENASPRPGLVRMNLSLPGEELPYTATFRVPAGGVTPSDLGGGAARDDDSGSGQARDNGQQRTPDITP